MIGAGWLVRNDALPYEVNGVPFRTSDPTRREEYHWAAGMVDAAHCGIDGWNPIVLDAGCGFDPTIHLFPYMIAPASALVLAVDANPEHLQMPPAPGIFRLVGDITKSNGATEIVDVYTCISVLEHLARGEQYSTLRSAFEMLKPGGLLIVTADELSPEALNSLAEFAGFEVGPVLPGDSDLSPKVSYLVARKP